MYKNVMVAIDDDPLMEAVLAEAAKLAGAGAALTVVTVADDPIRVIPISLKVSYDVPAMRRAALEAARETLGNATAKLSAQGVSAETQLIDLTAGGSDIPEALTHAAEGLHADLMVIGTHGRRGLRHLLLGSVAEHIIRVTPVPVLLVRLQ